MEPPKGVGPTVEAAPGLRSKSTPPIQGRGEEGPGVVGGGVGVFEGDAVEGDVVVAVGEAAEVGFGVTEADAVGVDAEGAGGVLDDLAE